VNGFIIAGKESLQRRESKVINRENQQAERRAGMWR
jgi:hypothetical protein